MVTQPAAPVSSGPFERGLFLGAGLGGLLSCVYAMCLAMAEALRIVWLAQDLRLFVVPFAAGLPVVLMIAMMAGYGVAMLAMLAATLGACTGALIGALWATLRQHISRRAFRWTGLLVCIVVVGLMHVVFDIHPEWGIPDPSGGELPSFGLYEAYASMIGIPSMIYMIAGIWGSDRLAHHAASERQ